MKPVDRILRQKALAFSLIAGCTLGTILKEQTGFGAGFLLDGILLACLFLGLALWVGAKRTERRGAREKQEPNE